MTARRVARLARYWCWLLAHDLLCGLRAYGAAMGCLQRAAALVECVACGELARKDGRGVAATEAARTAGLAEGAAAQAAELAAIADLVRERWPVPPREVLEMLGGEG